MSVIEKLESDNVLPVNLKTLVISALSGCLLAILVLLTYKNIPELAMLGFVIASALVVAIQLESYYRIQNTLYQQNDQLQKALALESQSRERDYLQIEAMFSIFNVLKLNSPLPAMRGWAISPDFAVLLISLMNQHQPKLIVEAGSGVSTLLMGYQVKRIGQGEIFSLDHDESYAKESMHQVIHHGLSEVATVIYAPLREVPIKHQAWQWYDTRELFAKLQQKIDLLVIDGPPGDLQFLSRYPALPVLFEALSDRAVIVMDDVGREDEQKIIERWQQEFNCSSVSLIANEKGAAILQIQK